MTAQQEEAPPLPALTDLFGSVNPSRHRDRSDVACLSAGSRQRHRQPLVRLPEPLGGGGEAPGSGSEEPAAGTLRCFS